MGREPSNIARRRAAARGDGRPEYAERRDEIMRVASRVFKERGFRGTTLGHVAEALGVDRASLYYYLSSKEELFQEIVQEAALVNVDAAEAIRDSDATAPEKVRRLIEDVMVSYAEHYPVLYVLLQENLNQVAPEHGEWAAEMKAVNRRDERIVIDIVQAGQDDGTLNASVPAWLAAYGIIGIAGWTNRWFNPADSRVTAEEIGSAFAGIVLAGLVQRAV